MTLDAFLNNVHGLMVGYCCNILCFDTRLGFKRNNIIIGLIPMLFIIFRLAVSKVMDTPILL